MRAMTRSELDAVTIKDLLERVRARAGVATAATLRPCEQALQRIFTARLAARGDGSGDDDDAAGDGAPTSELAAHRQPLVSPPHAVQTLHNGASDSASAETAVERTAAAPSDAFSNTHPLPPPPPSFAEPPPPQLVPPPPPRTFFWRGVPCAVVTHVA